MKTKNQWQVSDTTNSKHLGLIECNDRHGERREFELLELSDCLLFGGACNVGFLESGYILCEDYESLDDTLQELLADLECYYNDGPLYVSRIVCNERM